MTLLAACTSTVAPQLLPLVAALTPAASSMTSQMCLPCANTARSSCKTGRPWTAPSPSGFSAGNAKRSSTTACVGARNLSAPTSPETQHRLLACVIRWPMSVPRWQPPVCTVPSGSLSPKSWWPALLPTCRTWFCTAASTTRCPAPSRWTNSVRHRTSTPMQPSQPTFRNVALMRRSKRRSRRSSRLADSTRSSTCVVVNSTTS